MADASKIYQLAALLAQVGGIGSAPGTAGAKFANDLLESARGGIEAEAIKKERKRQEKKKKGGGLGKLGSMLGGALGTAATGGNPVGGLAGSTLGGMLGGGSPQDAATAGLQSLPGMYFNARNSPVPEDYAPVAGQAKAQAPGGPVVNAGLAAPSGGFAMQAPPDYTRPPQSQQEDGFWKRFGNALVGGQLRQQTYGPQVLQDPNDPNRRRLEW